MGLLQFVHKISNHKNMNCINNTTTTLNPLKDPKVVLRKKPLKPRNEMNSVPKLRNEFYRTEHTSEQDDYRIPEKHLPRNLPNDDQLILLRDRDLQSFALSRQEMLLSAQLAVLERFSDRNKTHMTFLEKTFRVYTDLSLNKKRWFDHILDIDSERKRTMYYSELVIHCLNALVSIKARKSQFQYIVCHIIPLLEQVLNRAKEIVAIPQIHLDDETSDSGDDSSKTLSDEIIMNFSESQEICLITMFGAFINIALIYAAVGQRRKASIAYCNSFLNLRPTQLLTGRIKGVPNEFSSDAEVWRWLRKQQYVVIYPCKEVAYKFGVF